MDEYLQEMIDGEVDPMQAYLWSVDKRLSEATSYEQFLDELKKFLYKLKDLIDKDYVRFDTNAEEQALNSIFTRACLVILPLIADKKSDLRRSRLDAHVL